MEEPRIGRFWNRARHELHATSVGRALWTRVRSGPRSPDVRQDLRTPGPYETSYDVAHGYSADRKIDTP